MKFTSWTACSLAGVFLLSMLGTLAVAQPPSNELPDGWRGLTTSEFIGKAHVAFDNKEPLSPEAIDAIRSYSAQLLRDTEGLSYEQRLALLEFAGNKLTATERATQQKALAGMTLTVDSVGDWPFWRMQRVHREMGLANLSQETKESLVIGWLNNHDLDSVTERWQAIWLCKRVCPLGTNSLDFSIRWTGFIKAPRDGKFIFSICPINVGVEHGNESVQQAMSVWIGGQQVLDSTANGWTYQGTPVTLSKDKPESIRVEFSYTHYQRNYMDHKPAIAKLLWEGPGVTKALVPATAFSLPDRSKNGLLAEYRLTVDGEKQTTTRTESMIDRAWFGNTPIIPKYPELQSRLIHHFCTLALDPSYLAKWDNAETAPQKHALWSAISFLGLMNSSEQAACVKALLARPVLLQAHPQLWTMDFYWKCRVADLDKSLDMLGTWAQMHPNAEPDFGQSEGDRERFRAIADAMVWQYRPHLDALEERYLEMPDGSCCLPVAYIVACGHLTEGRIREWIEKLDARLDDDALTGDRRVNWLLARGHAEEIRHSRMGRHFLPIEHMLAGRGWLDTAYMVAKSEPVRLRARKELLVRLAAAGKIDRARTLLDSTADRMSEPSSKAALADWKKKLDETALELDKQRTAAAELAKQNYINRLRKRHSKAVQSANTSAAGRYKQMLSDAGAKMD